MQAEPTPLRAEAEVALADPGRLIDRVLDHFAAHEFGVTREGDIARVAFLSGEAVLQVRPDALALRATAAHDAGLAYMKTVLATHVIGFAEGVRPEIVWTGHGADATAFPNFREMVVTQVADLTPHMRRIRLAGSDLDSFAANGLHFKLFVPPAGLARPEWPVPGRDGLPVWPAEDKRPAVRTYTIRRIDAGAGVFDVDFVLHGDHGIGSAWAMRARPGDIVGARGPLGRPIAKAEWYLLAGDETALPVIARHLEELPRDARGVALIEAGDETDRQEIACPPGIDLRWLYRRGAAPGTTTLLPDAVRAVAMPPPGTAIHALAGVEADAFKAIRHHWREVLKLDKKDVQAATYWRRGKAEGE